MLKVVLIITIILSLVLISGGVGYYIYRKRSEDTSAEAKGTAITPSPKKYSPNSSPNPPAGCFQCKGQPKGVFGCPNGAGILGKTKEGVTIPANKPVIISNFRVSEYNREFPNFVINGNSYWFRDYYDSRYCSEN